MTEEQTTTVIRENDIFDEIAEEQELIEKKIEESISKGEEGYKGVFSYKYKRNFINWIRLNYNIDDIKEKYKIFTLSDIYFDINFKPIYKELGKKYIKDKNIYEKYVNRKQY